MERKDIEKAANEEIELVGSSSALGVTIEKFCRESFVVGAEWRINSVWHDASEIPQIYGEYENDLYPQIPCLVLGHLSTGYGYGVRYWNVTHQVWDDEECDDFECKMDAIEKWAYLDDLLPTNEEDEK
jgi:hypothetical protein